MNTLPRPRFQATPSLPLALPPKGTQSRRLNIGTVAINDDAMDDFNEALQEVAASAPSVHADQIASLARWLQALGLMVNLEIKPSPGDEVRTGRVVAERVAEWWAQSEVKPLLSSFSLEALGAARDARPDLPRALLIDRWLPEAVDQAVELGCCALVVHQAFLSDRRIEMIHEAGLKALTYTVNEAERADTLWAAGLDGLITDRVDAFEPQARLGSRPSQRMKIDHLIAESTAVPEFAPD